MASGSTGNTRSGCAGTRARSGRRSAPLARSTRCGAALWRPLPADTLLDDVLAPMRAVLAGTASCSRSARSHTTGRRTTPRAESRRKTRTLAGNYQILGQEWRLLAPGLNPGVAAVHVAQGRPAAGPLGSAARFCVTQRLPGTDQWYYAAALTVQVGFYGLALVGGVVEMRGRRRSGVSTACPGLWARERGKWLAIARFAKVAFTFVMMNYAAVAGLVALRRGQDVWR